MHSQGQLATTLIGIGFGAILSAITGIWFRFTKRFSDIEKAVSKVTGTPEDIEQLQKTLTELVTQVALANERLRRVDSNETRINHMGETMAALATEIENTNRRINDHEGFHREERMIRREARETPISRNPTN